jgi:hypothetical protein
MKQPVILLLIIYSGFYSCRYAEKETLVNLATNDNKDPYIMISEGMKLIKDGDLVVRLSTDPCSQYLKNFNRNDKKYSHAGIVVFDNGRPYIFHIVNGEENPDEKLKKDSLKGFCDPRKNFAYGIFRYEIKPGEIERLKNFIHQWYRQGIQFDSTFNLKTDDRMYCSEMIYKALAKATNKRILIETTKPTIREAKFFSAYMHLPYSYTSKLEIIAVDNLYTNPYCSLIKEYNYQGY